MTIPTVVVIPSRYEPERLRALVLQVAKEAEVIVLDNGHEPPVPDRAGYWHTGTVTVVDARGDGLYRMWNRGWTLARARHPGPVNVAIVNDDVVLIPHAIEMLARALRTDPRIACVYPDVSVRHDRSLPSKIALTAEWNPAGGRSLTGFCFMFRGELHLPPFDEGMEWWYGDSEFDEEIKKAGYGVARVDKLPILHISDTESNDWARRPDLKVATGRDGARWAERHDRIVGGRWLPRPVRRDLGPAGRVVLLVPRRDDGGHRDALWRYCRARWEALTDWPIFEGYHDDGPFNRSAGINRAAKLAGAWDIAVVIDADILIARGQVEDAVLRAAETGKVTWPHVRWRSINEHWTRDILKHDIDLGSEVDAVDMDVPVDVTNPISWSCCVAIPRAVWDDLGGYDERFRGWGFEDMAFQSAIVGLYGHERIAGDVYHLWHERTVTTGGRAAKAKGEYTADAITNARLGRRYMVALRRDHGLHDRPGLPVSPEENERDIANLRRDDAKLAADAKRLGLPNWDDWWPSLFDLRDGARAYNTAAPSITLVVHSGGTAETWPVRREYLCRSLTSLVEHVSGPIVQRVVYDCWVDPAIRAELAAIAVPLGFYVVGPDTPVDYTGSMQAMWRYLGRRAQGAYIFQAEDDFTYERDVDLNELAAVLAADSGLVQMALMRDPYPAETARGGILGHPESAFTRRDGWLEHRLFFTANPSLFHRSLTAVAWPSGHHSETTFGRRVFTDPKRRAAFWGDGSPWISHIGAVKAGAGY